MDRNLALEVVRVTEAGALAAARFMGRGDEAAADQAAAEAIRRAFRSLPVRGTIVIGEGSEEEGIALYEGEAVGCAEEPIIDVAVDAVEGNLACATGGPNAMSIVAVAERTDRGFLRCPRTYMDKIAVGPRGRDAVDLDLSPTENLKRLAEARGVYIEDLTVVILDRPRHERLIAEVRAAGARIKLIPDGDVSAALATVRPDSGIDLVLGVGGASQGVLAAAALFCAGGKLQARFAPQSSEEAERIRGAAIHDSRRKLEISDLVGGSVMFAATGVTTGDSLQGVRFFRGGATTSSVVMRSRTRTIRTIESVHHFDFKPEY
ncbi:MAG: class II fructose-bisphosphatase [Candidatus Binatia bacterium]